MQSPHAKKTFRTRTTADLTNVSAPVAELSVLIDTIPPEYREDVLQAALRIGTNKTFQESYMVTSLRSQLCDCLLEKTGTLHDLKMLYQLDRSILERALSRLTTADDIEQIMIAIESLLNYLANEL